MEANPRDRNCRKPLRNCRRLVPDSASGGSADPVSICNWLETYAHAQSRPPMIRRLRYDKAAADSPTALRMCWSICARDAESRPEAAAAEEKAHPMRCCSGPPRRHEPALRDDDV